MTALPVTPVTPGASTTGDTNLQNAAAATGNGTTLQCSGMSTVVFTVSGTFSATVTFEGTEDGTNWSSIKVFQLGTESIATTATAVGTYEAACSGLQQVRARISAYTSGSVTVSATASLAPSNPRSMDVASIAGTALTAPGDAQVFAGTLPSVQMAQTGTGVASVRRTVTKFVQLKAQAVTAATPVDVYTPTTGKKFRILSYHISLSVAGSVLLEDATGVEVLRTPLMAAGIGQAAGNMGNGYLSTTANNHIFIDVTASGNVSGWIGISEE